MSSLPLPSAQDSTQLSSASAGKTAKQAKRERRKRKKLHERDESLPDVKFFSSDEDADDGADVIFVEHMPAAENRLSSQSEPERARTQPPQASAGSPPASASHVIAVDHAHQQPYIFTHYRRCSADIAAALKARDAASLLAILTCVRNHSQSSAPPIPSHKVRDRLLQLASPATRPPFLPVDVSLIASAIQFHWSNFKSRACTRRSSKDASASSAKSKKNAESSSKSKKMAAKKKKKKRKRKDISSSESSPIPTRRHKGKNKALKEKLRETSTLRSGTAFKAGVEMVACALAGCLRTFTSEISMLHHLRDKHKVLDARLTAKQRKGHAPSNLQLDSIGKSCIPPVQPTHSSPSTPAPAPAPLPIACVADDSVGARLLRLSGWTGGGLGPGGTGISGAYSSPSFSFFLIQFHGFFPISAHSFPAEPVNPVMAFHRRGLLHTFITLFHFCALTRSATGLGSQAGAGVTVEQVRPPCRRAHPRPPSPRSPPPEFRAACSERTALDYA
jgi:hypothetical protein